MPVTARWIFTAAMDVETDKEALFNEVYDTEHVPYIRQVPGVISAKRFKLDTLRVTIGGETKTVDNAGKPRYICMVELESPRCWTICRPSPRGRRCSIAGLGRTPSVAYADI